VNVASDFIYILLAEVEMIDWEEVIQVVKVAPHTYRHEWDTTALELLVKRVEDDLAKEAQFKSDRKVEPCGLSATARRELGVR
jgi:hypothetical protein